MVSARENHEARRGASSSCILFRSIPPWLPGTRAFLQPALSSLRLALGHLASLVTSLPGIPMMLYMGQRQASRHHSVGGAPCPPPIRQAALFPSHLGSRSSEAACHWYPRWPTVTVPLGLSVLKPGRSCANHDGWSCSGKKQSRISNSSGSKALHPPPRGTSSLKVAHP